MKRSFDCAETVGSIGIYGVFNLGFLIAGCIFDEGSFVVDSEIWVGKPEKFCMVLNHEQLSWKRT